MAVGPGGDSFARCLALNHVPAAVPQGFRPVAVVAGDDCSLHFLLCAGFVQVLHRLSCELKHFKLFCDRDVRVAVQRVGSGIGTVRPVFFCHHRIAPAGNGTGSAADGGILDGEAGRDLLLRHIRAQIGGNLDHIFGQILCGERGRVHDGRHLPDSGEARTVGNMQSFGSCKRNIFDQLHMAIDPAR